MHFSNNVLILIITLIYLSVAWGQPIEAHETTLTVQLDTGNPAPYGMPSIIISIQGKYFPILLDTGAKKSELVLSPQVLGKIHVRFTGKKVCFKAFDGKYCQPEFIIPEVILGSFVVKNVHGTVMRKFWDSNHDNNFISTAAFKNGVMGYALLSQYNVLLDFPRKKMVLTKPQTQPTNYDINHWISIPFKGHLQTKLQIDHQPIILCWDTGAIPSVIRQKNFKSVPCPTLAPYRKNCLSVVTHTFTTSANTTLPNTWFSIADIPAYAPFEGLIGSNFYAVNQVYFDFDHHKIYVKPRQPSHIPL